MGRHTCTAARQGRPESQLCDVQVPQQAHLSVDGNGLLLCEKNGYGVVAVAYGQVQRAVFLRNSVVDVSTRSNQQRQGLSMVALNGQDQSCPVP